MVHILTENNSLASQFLAEIRDKEVQKDSLRFRRNMERLGEIFAYEISRELEWHKKPVSTPLGTAECKVLKEQPVLVTILRAGLALHQGLLSFFDKADNAFISAYRKHTGDSFTIKLEYFTSPPIEGRTLIISDPMLATGASMAGTVEMLKKEGLPSAIHIVTAIASAQGIEYVHKHLPEAVIWAGAVDEELNDKAYIVPGLGDAGDLAFGEKIQH